MSNMTTEFEENKTRELAISMSKRNSRCRQSRSGADLQGEITRGFLGGRGSKQSVDLLNDAREKRMEHRKSIIDIANKELIDFEMDNAKLKELKKLRKQSRAHNTEHLNRRRSVSTSQINDCTGTDFIPINIEQRIRLQCGNGLVNSFKDKSKAFIMVDE